ncbi:MAG: helix-turn-helix domain-containing protein, partial [Planctomycetales bacterium]|nr:helix-turn-helix domain-containing protein [Planctomycetales bacterium]
AAKQLGVSPEKLNDLREHGELRAYRDGPSWKFRTDEIDKMQQEGVPELPPSSELDLKPLDLEGDLSEPLDLEVEDTDTVSAGSELELDDLEDTVTTGASDIQLALDEEPSDLTDSILLSDEELGESMSASGSTIVGKDALDSDADLELASDSAQEIHSAASGASDVLSSESASGDVLDELGLESSGVGASGFEDLEELEIDLAAESSRILSPDEAAQVEAAASLPVSDQGDSDLTLDDGIPGSDVDNDMGSTDVPLLEAEAAAVDEGSGSEIELSIDDDLVLSDSEGSDITLGSGDSGINLAPADSGLALDDIPLEIGGSAILSSLDLSGSDPEISLVGSGPDIGGTAEAELQTDEDFQLTPLSEGGLSEEGDSSSQVIALDADIDDLGDDVGVLDDDVGFSEDVGHDVMIAEDFASAPGDEFEMGSYAGAGPAGVSAEVPYSVGQLIGLFSCVAMVSLAGVMMLDMIRNIWSWDEPYSLSSSLIDSLLGLFS